MQRRMIVRCQGLKIDKYLIPHFELKEREFINICLYGGEHFFDLELKLVKHLTSKSINPRFNVYKEITFADDFKQSRFKRVFFPLTVRKYLNAFGIEENKELEKIYEIVNVTPETKMHTLSGDNRKCISLYTAFSQSRNIVFDLVGQSPIGSTKILRMVSDFVNNGASAILLDNVDSSEPVFNRLYNIEIDH
ncbi:MAG: hypothetical protein N4A71_20750 [Carboxylicivirga sp.]|jgi:hypothetical protein|nr:hypothetical protein [Carboxylicivirga sp.]MCT4645532.1 hypothetical protein [Carboxylicivirga sp.]